ncbi:MAG TPA: hypothetical protein VGF55_06550 [Gemmataceae bacterium]|jgi:hypothetical protein
MLRKLFGTLAVAVVLCVGAVLADEIKGKVTKVDQDKKQVTVTVDGKEMTYDLADDCKYPMAGKGKEGTLKSFSKQVDKAGDKGVNVTITTNDKKHVTEIKRERNKAPQQ